MNKLVLDGYNVIHHIPKLAKNLDFDFEFARNVLVNFMKVWEGEHGFKGRIYIVFDGDGSVSNSKLTDGVACTFTRSGQTADDYIIAMVKNDKNPKKITVVSNDGSIKNSCFLAGAVVQDPIFLLQSPKSYCRKLKNTKSSKEISSAHKNEINRFLMDEWEIK